MNWHPRIYSSGYRVLEHLRADTHTLLNSNRFALNEADCSAVENPTDESNGGCVSLLLIARLNGETSTQTSLPTCESPCVNYHTARHDENPLPDSALLDPVDIDQHEDIRNAVDVIISTAIGNCVPETNSNAPQEAFSEHINIFRTPHLFRTPASS